MHAEAVEEKKYLENLSLAQKQDIIFERLNRWVDNTRPSVNSSDSLKTQTNRHGTTY